MPIPFGAAVLSVIAGAVGAIAASQMEKRIEKHDTGAPQLPAGASPPQLPPAGVKGAEAEIVGCATCGDVGCGCAVGEADDVSGWGIRVKFVDKGGIPVREMASGWAIPLRKVTDEPGKPAELPPAPTTKALPPGPVAPPPPAPPTTVKGWAVPDDTGGLGDQIFKGAEAGGGALLNAFIPGAGTAAVSAADLIKNKVDQETGHNPNAGPYALSNMPGAKQAPPAEGAPIITSEEEHPSASPQPGTVGWRGKNVYCGGAPGWVPVTQGTKAEGVHGVEPDDLGLVTDDLGADDLGGAPSPASFGGFKKDGAWHWRTHAGHVAYNEALAAWKAQGGNGGGEERIIGWRRPRHHREHHPEHREHKKNHPHKPAHHKGRHGVRGFENEEGVEGTMSDDLGFVELPAPKPASYGATQLANGQWKWPNNNALRAYVKARNAWMANHNKLEAQSKRYRKAGPAPRPSRVVADLGSHAKERAARIACQQKLNKCHHHSYQRRLTIERLLRQVATLQSKVAWCTSALSAAQSQGVQLDPLLTASPVAYDPSADDGSYVSDGSMDATFSDIDSTDSADADNFSDDGGGDADGGGDDDNTSGLMLDDLGLSEVQRDEILARLEARRAGGEIIGEQHRRGPRGKEEITEKVVKDGRVVEEHFEFPKRVHKHVLEIRRLHHAIAAVRSASRHEEEHVRHLVGGVRALECEIDRAMRALGHKNAAAWNRILFSPRGGGVAGVDDLGEVIEEIEEIEVPSPHHKGRKHKRPEYEHTIRHLRALLGEEEARLEREEEHADRLLHCIRALEHLIRFGEHFFHDQNERMGAEIAARRTSDGTAGVDDVGRGGGGVEVELDDTGYAPYGGSAPSPKEDERVSGWQPLFAAPSKGKKDDLGGAGKDDLAGCNTCQVESPVRRYVDPLASYRRGRDGDGLN